MAKPDDQEKAGWTVTNWARRYDLPRSTAYKLIKSGNGPKVIKLPGINKSIITVEADVEWRERLNQEQGAAA